MVTKGWLYLQHQPTFEIKRKENAKGKEPKSYMATELASFKEFHKLPIWFKSKALDQTPNICLNSCFSQHSWLQALEITLAILIFFDNFPEWYWPNYLEVSVLENKEEPRASPRVKDTPDTSHKCCYHKTPPWLPQVNSQPSFFFFFLHNLIQIQSSEQ